jgi:hypothetical protein
MAVHNILAIKNAGLKIAPTRVTPTFQTFEDALDSAQLNLTSDDFQWVPISGNVQNQTGAIKWEVQLNLGQDTKTGGLMQFLVANHGVAGKLEYYPKGGSTTPKVAADIIIKAPATIGGGVGVATTTASLKVDGQPVITWEP